MPSGPEVGVEEVGQDECQDVEINVVYTPVGYSGSAKRFFPARYLEPRRMRWACDQVRVTRLRTKKL